MGHRDFDAALAEAKKEQPTFTLAGQHFTCRATLPWKALEHLIEGDGLSVQVHQFFANVLVKSDRQRFADLVEQEDPEDDEAVSVEQITDVMNWLTEHYTGKAEQQSPSSTDGQGNWPIVEGRQPGGTDRVTARRLLCLIEETMISERRAQQVAMGAASKFVAAGDPVTDVRAELADLLSGETQRTSRQGLERIGEVG